MSASTTAIRTPFATNASPAADATLLIPQTSNPQSDAAISNSMLAALLRKINQLTAVLATQEANRAAVSRALAAVSDRLRCLERSRVDRGDRKAMELQSSASAAPQLSTVVVDNRESRQNRSHPPPENAVLDPMRYCGILPMPSANRSRKSDWDRRDASRPFVLPLDRHAGSAAIAVPLTHAAFPSLSPPPVPQPLLFHSSVPSPMPSLPFADESYPSLAPFVSVAAVLDPADAAVYVSVESECRCWNRLGRY